MMKQILSLVLTLAPLALARPALDQPSPQTERSDAFAYVRALDEARAKNVWPGFNPTAWPLALFDGEKTILLRHPSPPPEFTPMPGRPGVLVSPGRHPAMAGNSTRDIGGVRTATVIANSVRTMESNLLACVEEVFHVFWLARHPGFRPNETARYAYPLKDVENLRAILAEDEALARSLDTGTDAEAAAWAAAALRIRRERTPRLEEDVRTFETALEMMEGTANYAARVALAEGPEKTAVRLRQRRSAEDIRWRFYDTGAALCLLLDRFHPDWKVRIDNEPDLTTIALLEAVFSRRGVKPSEFSKTETADFQAKAESDVADLAGRRQRLRQELFDRPGLRVVIEAEEGAEPLRLQRFHPINLFVLEDGEVEHASYITLSNSSGTVEMTNPDFTPNSFAGTVGLTGSSGRHPLDGIRRLTVVGIQGEPRIGLEEGAVTVEANGLRIKFQGAEVRTEGGTIRIILPARSPSA